MQIPTFIPAGLSTEEELKSQWFSYAHKYFNPDQVEDLKTPVRKALDYNLSQIKTPLNNPALESWTDILLLSKDTYPPATFFGGYLRQFYDKSNKSATDFTLIRILLANKATISEQIDFVREIADNYHTYEQFYSGINYSVRTFMPSVLNKITSSVADRPRAEFLIGFVFSPHFLTQTNKYVNKNIIDMLSYLDTRIEFLFEHIFKDNQAKINFLVSSLYILDRSKDTIININNQTDECSDPKLYQRITIFFESTYPELYKQYKVMKTLDLGLSLTEIATNLIVRVDEPEQSLSRIEF